MSKWVHRILTSDEATMTGECASCGPVSLIKKRNLLMCKPAHKARKRREAAQQYGNYVSEETWIKMFKAQNGTCAICNSRTMLVVDHDHKTGLIRGLLCNECNLGLGLFRDDPVALEKARQYIEEPPGR